jgi:hypothetical protein
MAEHLALQTEENLRAGVSPARELSSHVVAIPTTYLGMRIDS